MSSKPLLSSSEDSSTNSDYRSITAIKSEEDEISIPHPHENLLEDDILQLPLIVRQSVSLTDDPTIPVITFRYVLLTIIFIIPGAILGTMNSFRTTSAAYSIFFVQIVSHWCGKWLARTLPNKEINFGRYSFNLNPGPWSIKETVLVTISAASGATGNMATFGLSLSELYYNETIHPLKAMVFMWGIVFTGYSYAAIARNFLIYEPDFIWPQALMQSTLFQSQSANDKDSVKGHKQMKVFWIALIGMSVWQFFPEYIFPMTSSLAVLCWMAPYNKKLNFMGSGLGGMGVLNFSLDWSNITSSIMVNPYWVQMIQFVAFVIGAWILIPLCKWGNITSFKEGLMNNHLLLANGSRYPVNELMTADFRLNETAYELLGPVHLGTQRLWNIFFDYAAYISGFTWLILFGRDKLVSSYAKFRDNMKKRQGNVNKQYSDRLNKLQSAYEDVPMSWFLILFLLSFFSMLVIMTTGTGMFIPVWTYLVALAFGAAIIIPMGWLYAVSNFQLAIGTFNELLYGYMIQSASYKHPAGASFYGSISGNAWYRAQYMLQDQKIGHYMHIPPKAVFFSQIFGELIGVPINYLSLQWIIRTKKTYLLGIQKDPLNQWTGQSLINYQTNAIQYVLLGPTRLFQNYPLLPYGFLAGLLAPYIIYRLQKLFPNGKFHLFNTTIFFSSMSTFHGYISTGYFSKFIGGTITMYYIYRHKFPLWSRYNYILAAAFDTGYNFAVLGVFILFSYNVKMPNWWGNNSDSIERCFALN